MSFIYDLQPLEVFINKISKDMDLTSKIMVTLTDCYGQHYFMAYYSTLQSLNDKMSLLNDIYIYDHTRLFC